jgi:hypothetical protein
MIPGIERRKVERVGVISTTVVSEEEMPPGIQRLIERSNQPWGVVQYYSFQLVSKLVETDEYWDRCIHTFTKKEGENQIPTLTFDWQRFFKQQHPARKNVLVEAAEKGQGAALAYFERLAEGAGFDV